MADLEQEEVIDDVTDVTEENNEETNENDSSKDTITWEQAQEWKAKAERLDKAEKKLVEQKKALKEKEKQEQKPDNISSKDEVRKIMAEEKFYDKNPEAESYRDKIEKYQSKGLSLEDSYLLASKSDQEVDAKREVYGKSIVRGDQSSSEWVKLVDLAQFDRMTPDEQNKYNSETKSKFWGVRFK